MSQIIYGRITNYRVGNKSQTPRECLVEFKGINSAAVAGKLVGQKVAWKAGEKVRLGQVKALHGRNGIVKVRFRRGVPGEAIGTVVQIVN